MGISAIDPRHRLALPHTPPELVSPGGLSNPPPPRASEDRPWNSGVPISPPMTNYDPPSKTTELSSAARSSDESLPAAREAVQMAAPKQQLPSLSSLFGPPSAVRPPLQSPLSERPGSHTSTSPRDRHFSSASGLDRPYSSSSYFPSASTPSMAQPRSAYEPRFEDRLPLGPLSRAFPGHPSPRSREPERQRPEPGSESGGQRWAYQQEVRGGEYALSREAPYRTTVDRQQPHMGGRRYELDHGMGYGREQGQPHGTSNGTQHPPPTPGSVVTIAGVTVKDGLGPKIWTGTQFLPRFVRAAEVPGEGMCYFYDDGSHCKTVIDGEAVNAHWGVTKAGKPRKRLAIACITCREKKIKCDPDYPRCVQCEKFGRVCKFKNAPRGGNNTSPSAEPAETDDSRQLPPLIRAPPDHPRPGSHSSGSVSPRTAHRPASPEPVGHSAKRMRIGYEHYVPTSGGTPPGGYQRASPPAMLRMPPLPMPENTVMRSSSSSVLSWHHAHHQSHPQQQQQQQSSQQPLPPPPQPQQQPQAPRRELARIHEDVLCRMWQTDPYVSDPQSVLSTISSFFAHCGDATAALRFLPEKPFVSFVTGGGVGGHAGDSKAHVRKSPEDLMLVYSILALGVSLSPGGSKAAAAAHEYAEVARYATDRVPLSLQLVQARLLLSLYYLQVSRPSDANDMSSAAISTATCLQLNMELKQQQQQQQREEVEEEKAGAGKYPFGLNRAAYAECRRRTFWACFVLERLNGLFPTRISIIDKADVFLRLPSDAASFENQTGLGQTPMFDPDFDFRRTLPEPEKGISVMAYLVQVVALWGDVMTTIYRLAHRGPQHAFDFAAYQSATLARLAGWHESLPATLTWSPANLCLVPAEEKGSFILMHLVHHLATIKLHRHIHPRFLHSSDHRHAAALAAREHADRLLDIVYAVAKERSLGRSMMPPPFTSYAILEIVDVLSAQGPLSGLPQLVDRLATARSVLEILATVWDDAVGHKAALDHRLDKLAWLRNRAAAGEAADSQGMQGLEGVKVWVNERDDEERGLPKGLCWQMVAGSLEGRFPREMDTVYASLATVGSSPDGPPPASGDD